MAITFSLLRLLVPEQVNAACQVNVPDSGHSSAGFKPIVSNGITLLMPFDFERNLKPDTSDLTEQYITKGSLPWINFYEGLQLASDSADTNSMHLQTDVFDSAVDSIALLSLIKDGSLFRHKILIAVVPAWSKPLLEEMSTEKQVLLFYVQNDIVKTPVRAASLTPTNRMMICSMSDWLVQQHKDNQIIIVYRENAKEKMLADLFFASIDSCSKKTVVPVMVNYSLQKAKGLLKQLSSTNENCIVITSSDEAWVSPVVNSLADTLNEKKITICGLPTWHAFETVDVNKLILLNLHYFIYEWIDYTNVEVDRFRQQFIDRYMNDPLFNAFQGYYFAKGIINATEKNKTSTLNNLQDFNSCFNPAFFRFISTPEGIIINAATSVVKLSEYALVKVY